MVQTTIFFLFASASRYLVNRTVPIPRSGP